MPEVEEDAVPQEAEEAELQEGEVDLIMVSKWEAFINDNEDASNAVRELGDLYPDMQSIYIKFNDLDKYDSDLANNLLDHPIENLLAAEIAVKNRLPAPSKRWRIMVRPIELPRDTKVDIRNLREKHLGKLVAVEGLVRRVTAIKPSTTKAVFFCKSCKHEVMEIQDGPGFQEPLECYSDQGGCGTSASKTRFLFKALKSEYLDRQKLEVQENPEGLRGGSQPERATAYLANDLVMEVYPGDKVILNAVYKPDEKDKPKGKEFDTCLDIISVERQDSDYEEVEITEEDIAAILEAARDRNLKKNMIASLAPGIFGYDMEKLSLILQLFGGVPKLLDDGSRLRGDMHILLVGDPGVAKSQLLRASSRLAPRGVFASGKSASGVGLTAAAVQDEWGEGKWSLEAGALVLSDKGLCAVDELDKMNDQDRSALHEAMEQQQISVAKAGITATLQCRCSLLGAANPKRGRWDENLPVGDQINLSPPLLSRFDLIFPFMDRVEKDRDEKICRHIIRSHRRGEAFKNKGAGMEEVLEKTSNLKPYYSVDFMRKYTSYAKKHCTPIINDEVEDALVKKYVEIRQKGAGPDKPIPITARQVEGMVRMAEAMARMRLSEVVEVSDADVAVGLMDYYLKKMATDGGVLDMDKVMTGTTKKTRNAQTICAEIIKDGGPEGLKVEDYLEEATNRKIDREVALDMLKRLKALKEVYEPKMGTVKLVPQ